MAQIWAKFGNFLEFLVMEKELSLMKHTVVISWKNTTVQYMTYEGYYQLSLNWSTLNLTLQKSICPESSDPAQV